MYTVGRPPVRRACWRPTVRNTCQSSASKAHVLACACNDAVASGTVQITNPGCDTTEYSPPFPLRIYTYHIYRFPLALRLLTRDWPSGFSTSDWLSVTSHVCLLSFQVPSVRQLNRAGTQLASVHLPVTPFIKCSRREGSYNTGRVSLTDSLPQFPVWT